MSSSFSSAILKSAKKLTQSSRFSLSALNRAFIFCFAFTPSCKDWACSNWHDEFLMFTRRWIMLTALRFWIRETSFTDVNGFYTLSLRMFGLMSVRFNVLTSCRTYIFDVMWYSGQSYPVIFRATRGLGLVKRLRFSFVVVSSSKSTHSRGSG